MLTYRGESLNFSDVELDSALQKHYPFYNRQDDSNRQVFLHRLKNFIAEKKFFIHCGSGFKEMPILVSAAAIQLTFGLKKYLLTHFENIHIYPEEFMRVTHSIDFLEGNVSGHNINISWKHFLDGINDPNDGANVGLHEMAHALYYQTFVAGENVDRSFHDLYKHFIQDGNKTFQQEQHKPGSLYSEYAIRNFQEFWAESVELFFEKPEEMNLHYPSLYQTICFLLNQDPMKDHSGRS